MFQLRGDENSKSMVGVEVTRLQMLRKSPGLAVEEVSLTSALLFRHALRALNASGLSLEVRD